MGNELKKILIIAMQDSIHTARWIAQIVNQGWEIHLFPSLDTDKLHPIMNTITVHNTLYETGNSSHENVVQRGIPVPGPKSLFWGKELLRKFSPNYRVRKLKRVIEEIRPDIVHSLEIQHAGYLTLEVKKLLGEKFPPWIVTNWGSDIYLFSRLSWHEQRVREVLASCDYYSCECQRDVCLATYYGFNGTVLPVFPNTGGFDLPKCFSLRKSGAVAQRRTIMLKGYQGWAGRALVGLRALERCADILSGYRIYIHSAMCDDVVIAAELFRKSTGIPLEFVTPGSPHEVILRLHGESRISIGLSISDGISTSLLEAMVMGSFPIQSFTACADEWLVDGESGILVHPDDPDNVEAAIRRALSDDDLVNSAAEHNRRVAEERLDCRLIKERTLDYYRQTLGAK
jgi:hypothetical protein